MKVREANSTDLSKIVELGKGFYDQTFHAGLSDYNPGAVESLVRTMLTNSEAHVFVAETDKGEVVGMTGAILFPLWTSPTHKTGQEMFWYVQPEHRKSRAGKLLFDALEKWAKEQGATTFCMVALSSLHEARVGQMYESKGYIPMERSYIRTF